MAQASAGIDIAASPSDVWQLIGGFNSLRDCLGDIPKSEFSEGGRVRYLVNPKGAYRTKTREPVRPPRAPLHS